MKILSIINERGKGIFTYPITGFEAEVAEEEGLNPFPVVAGCYFLGWARDNFY